MLRTGALSKGTFQYWAPCSTKWFIWTKTAWNYIRDCVQTTWTSEGGGELLKCLLYLIRAIYLKCLRRGEGIKNAPNSVYVVCTQPFTRITQWYTIFDQVTIIVFLLCNCVYIGNLYIIFPVVTSIIGSAIFL